MLNFTVNDTKKELQKKLDRQLFQTKKKNNNNNNNK